MSIKLLPLVLPIDRPAVLSVEGLAPHAQYRIQVRPRRQLGPVSEYELAAGQEGHLCIEAAYAAAGEYIADVYAAPAPDRPATQADRLARLHFFVAADDLFARRPLRCDFHIHTLYSDGHSSPAEMVIRARQLGLDVAVITDHNHYEGSIEAVAERDRLGLNLITMPGEEVSAPDWHILSINADAPIYGLMLETFGLEGADSADREARLSEYDTLRWAVRAVQAHGGRAYLAHPYWAVFRGFHLPAALYDQVLEEGILDGLELLGDVRHENNIRSLARYLDLRATGHDLPILGNSDTHWAAHTYGLYWTLVFAEQDRLSPAGVLDAITEGWSVACMTVGGPDPYQSREVVEPAVPARRRGLVQAFGGFELVDYAYFLEQQFFPLHDALSADEAALGYRIWRGERLPGDTLAACQAEVEALYARCWGRR